MDLVVKSTGGTVSSHARQVVERKVARLARHDPRVRRVEVHLVQEPNPRVNGGNTVEASCWTGRRRFNATAGGSSVDTAIEQVVSRLDRQISAEVGKRRRRLLDGANRVKSRQIPTDEGPRLGPEG